MLDKFRTLLGHTLIYGLGNYGIKVIGFLLIPLYTRFLSTGDYGIMALVSIYTQALFIMVNMGQSTSLFRFYYDHDTQEGRDRVIASSLWILILFSLPIAAVPLLAPRLISGWVLNDPTYWYLITIGTGTVLCKVLLRMPFQMMRAADQSKKYAMWSIVRNGLTTATAVVLVAFFAMKATGVILAQFVGEFTMCLVLTWPALRAFKAGFHWEGIKDQLKYGLPLVPAGAAAFILDLTDRWFIKEYYSVSEVGIYALGYRFGEIMTFVVTAFQLSWPQFIFRNQKEENAPELYAQMATYYIAFLLFLWLGLSAFSDDLIQIMATPAFYAAATVVPIIGFALVLDGMTFMVKVGILITKKTYFRTITIFIAAGLNVGLNFLLIPTYGMVGAAWATLGGFFVQVTLTLWFSQRLYHVPFPWLKIAWIVGGALVTFFLARSITFDSIAASIAFKSAIMPLYPLALLASGLFAPKDVDRGLTFAGEKAPKAKPLLEKLRPLVRYIPGE